MHLGGTKGRKINALQRRHAKRTQYAVERADGHAAGRGDFDADRAAIGREVDNQARGSAARSCAAVARAAREEEVRGEGPTVPECDFEVRTIAAAHGAIG